MKLSRVNYKSAVFFGVFAFVIYIIMGILMTILSQSSTMVEEIPALRNISSFETIVMAPLVGGILTYLIAILAICVYNKIAKEYPISWEVKK